MNRKIVLLSIFAGALAGIGAPALAVSDTLYAVEYPGFLDLSVVNQSTGALSSVGPTGRGGLGDMTSDTRDASFRMWSVEMASKELVTLDPVTGGVLSGVIMNAPDQIISIAFDVVTSKLYGNSAVGFGAPFDALYEIDPANGNCTFIGRITYENVYALAFDQGGTLYGIADASDDLISISTVSGNGTLIAELPQLSGFDLASRPSDDTMFLAMSDFPGSLATIDTGTGVITPIGTYDPNVLRNVVGLAFGPVPTPAAGSLLVLAGAGALRRRSRR